jgi:hypothetical protein
MKKLIILSAMVLSSLGYKAADAQIRVNITIGSQPAWGPYGYQRADYYYLPEIGVYYNVARRTFTYYQGNRWITQAALSGPYKHYDLYRGYKVVINARDPWLRHAIYQSRYASFAGKHDQRTIRDYRKRPSSADHHRKNNRRRSFSYGNVRGDEPSRPQIRS